MFSASLWWLWRRYIILLSYVCVCRWPRTNLATTGVTRLFNVRQPSAECWYILAGAGTFLYTTSLPPFTRLLLEGKRLSTESSRKTEHIPLRRRDRQVRLRALFFFCKWMLLPIISEGFQFDTDGFAWNKRLALAFQREHTTDTQNLCLCVCVWKTPKCPNRRFSLVCLAFIAIYCFSKKKKEPFNVNSLQKDLYVYQEMYLLATLNI